MLDVAHALPLRAMLPHGALVRAAAFDADGSRVVTGADDGHVRVWDSTTGVLLKDFAGLKARVTMVAINKDGSRITSRSADGVARLWNTGSGSMVVVAPKVAAVAFSPDGAILLTVSRVNGARLWSSEHGAPGFVLQGAGDGTTMQARFSPDGGTRPPARPAASSRPRPASGRPSSVLTAPVSSPAPIGPRRHGTPRRARLPEHSTATGSRGRLPTTRRAAGSRCCGKTAPPGSTILRP